MKYHSLFNVHNQYPVMPIDLLNNMSTRTRQGRSTAETEGFLDNYAVILLLFSFVYSLSFTQFFCCCYAQVHYF